MSANAAPIPAISHPVDLGADIGRITGRRLLVTKRKGGIGPGWTRLAAGATVTHANIEVATTRDAEKREWTGVQIAAAPGGEITLQGPLVFREVNDGPTYSKMQRIRVLQTAGFLLAAAVAVPSSIAALWMKPEFFLGMLGAMMFCILAASVGDFEKIDRYDVAPVA